MAHKLLLIGNNISVIDVFFDFLADSFTSMTCSSRTEDIRMHLDAVSFDALVYALSDEPEQTYERVNQIKALLAERGLPIIICGTVQDCSTFQTKTESAARQMIAKPFSNSTLKTTISELLEEIQQQREIQELLTSSMAEQNRKKQILIIDDDPLMLKIIKEHLHDRYDVATAKGGSMAYRFMEKKPTDLILLDYEMPEENGPTVLEKLRQIRGYENVPVVFLTGVTDKAKIMEAVKKKPQGYLVKPVDKAKLLEKVQSLIG